MNRSLIKFITGCGPIYLILNTGNSISLFSQNGCLPLNYRLRSMNEIAIEGQDETESMASSFHPGIERIEQGNRSNEFRSYIGTDKGDSAFLRKIKYSQYSWFRRKLFYESLIEIDTGDIHIAIDPLMELSAGTENYSFENGGPVETTQRTLYTNTRGLLVRAQIGRKFAIESYVYENQARFPSYVDSFARDFQVVPGQGRVKRFKGGDFDFAQSGAYFSYVPGEHFSIQFGHHKLFIGDGYRSLMLSDNSFNYPFLRLNFRIWQNRICYTVMFASFQVLNRLPNSTASEAAFYRKGGSFHNMDIFALKWLKFNLFQGMIWRTMDEGGRRILSGNMFNPLIFANPLFYKGDADAATLIGAGFRLKVISRSSVYGQLIRQYWVNRNGWQLGVSYGINRRFRIQLEWNRLEYPGRAKVSSVYSHYNQFLAHPLGTVFNEKLIRLDYRYRRLLFGIRIHSANTTFTAFDAGSRMLVDETKTLKWFNSEIAWLINPATNLKLFANFTYRMEDFELNPGKLTNFVYLGIRTDLRNIYTDF